MVLSNISVFGDSIGKGIITFGDKKGVSDRSAVKLFEERFHTIIDNRSKFGQTLAKSFRRGEFDKYIKTIKKDDEATVVIELGNNDCAYFWENVALNPDRPHDPFLFICAERFQRLHMPFESVDALLLVKEKDIDHVAVKLAALEKLIGQGE